MGVSSSLRKAGWGVAVGALAYGAYRGAAAVFQPRSPDVALAAGTWLVHKPRRVLALAATPGELEFFAGGTLALLGAGDGKVVAAVATDGDDGRRLRNLGDIRRREQESAAAVLRYERLLWLGRTFRQAADAITLLADVERLMAETEPDILLAPDPRGVTPSLGGGRGGGRAAASGGVPAGPSVRAALGHAVLALARNGLRGETAVLLYGTRQPNVLVDMTETLQEKITAVKCHRSRLVGPDGLAGWGVRRLSRPGQERLPSMYVEGFYRLV